MLRVITILFIVVVHSVYSQSLSNCRCVSFHLCREDSGTIITDGETLVNERFGELCPACDCTGGDVCCSLTNETIPEVTLKKNVKQCGYRNPDGVAFKINGENTDAFFGEFPWMIGIFENGKYRCGGSLIHPSVVLTAAHCVKLPSIAYTVRAGEWDSASTVETLKHQDRSVESIKTHEKFNAKNYHNDIALIFVKEPFILAPHINVVCLVPADLVVKNTRCLATGWGKDQFGVNGKNLPILKKVDLPVLEHDECQKLFRETRLGAYFEFHESFVCAGGEKDKDTCTGDGGGPLFCPIDDEEERFQQVGITAWGIGCNEENVPGAYVNVRAMRNWIDKQISDKNLNVKEYQYKKK